MAVFAIIRRCFPNAGDDGFVRLDEAPQPPGLRATLPATLGFLQWDILDARSWAAVANTLENVVEMDDPFIVSSAEEAYFAVQSAPAGSVPRTQADLHTRVLRRFMNQLKGCPQDPRFDAARAREVFGEANHAFYVDVCRAFGTMR